MGAQLVGVSGPVEQAAGRIDNQQFLVPLDAEFGDLTKPPRRIEAQEENTGHRTTIGTDRNGIGHRRNAGGKFTIGVGQANGGIAIGRRKTGNAADGAREGVVELRQLTSGGNVVSRRFAHGAVGCNHQISDITLQLHLPLERFDLFAVRRGGIGAQQAQEEWIAGPGLGQLPVVAIVAFERLHTHGDGAAERGFEVRRKGLLQFPMAGQKENRNRHGNGDPFPRGTTRTLGRRIRVGSGRGHHLPLISTHVHFS